jgi:hypothetical protein
VDDCRGTRGRIFWEDKEGLLGLLGLFRKKSPKNGLFRKKSPKNDGK